MASMTTIRHAVKTFATPIHARLRTSRTQLAIRLMEPDSNMSLLDVGGGHGYGREFDPLRERFGSITLLNPDPRVHRLAKASPLPLSVVDGDGCHLPWGDRSFDWVFSNAVLEHVGNRQRQEQFAGEIQRVARIGYFVSTPNRGFPLDPHTYLPLYHLMPEWVQKRLCNVSLGEARVWEPLRLVDQVELSKLFPEAKVMLVGPWELGLNLVAFRRFPASGSRPD